MTIDKEMMNHLEETNRQMLDVLHHMAQYFPDLADEEHIQFIGGMLLEQRNLLENMMKG